MLWFLALIAALVTPHDLESRGSLPPRSFELTLTAAYADATVVLNGVPVLEIRAEAGRTHKLLLNGFLKDKANTLDVTLSAAFPGHDASGWLKVQSYAAGGGPESIMTELDRRLEVPFDRRFNFDAPGTPQLAVWSAQDAALDDAARAAIASDLATFQGEAIAALQARDTRRLIALFQSYSGNRDAARFLPADDASSMAAAMLDELAPVVNDPVAREIATAPPPVLGDLAFRRAGRFVIVSRKDGGAVLGFMFRGDAGPGGMTLDRPVFGRVNGAWVMLQDFPLTR
jgi:hypothetical protein